MDTSTSHDDCGECGNECSEDEVCVEGACVGCASDEQCDEGLVCLDGHCAEPPPEEDEPEIALRSALATFERDVRRLRDRLEH